MLHFNFKKCDAQSNSSPLFSQVSATLWKIWMERIWKAVWAPCVNNSELKRLSLCYSVYHHSNPRMALNPASQITDALWCSKNPESYQGKSILTNKTILSILTNNTAHIATGAWWQVFCIPIRYEECHLINDGKSQQMENHSHLLIHWAFIACPLCARLCAEMQSLLLGDHCIWEYTSNYNSVTC